MHPTKGGRSAMLVRSTPRACSSRQRLALASGVAGAGIQKRDQKAPCSGRKAARTSQTASRKGAESGGRPIGQRTHHSATEKVVAATTAPAVTARLRALTAVWMAKPANTGETSSTAASTRTPESGLST